MQRKSSKRYLKAIGMLDPLAKYPLNKAVEVLQTLPRAKFDETVEVSFNLGVDPRQSDQMVRGTVSLPHGSGRKVRVIVFTKPGPSFDAAVEAGAEGVGFEDLIAKCTGGWVDFDVSIATPEEMAEVRKLGKILGPRGLMPNTKTGKITDDTGNSVKEFIAGRVEYKVDKTSNLSLPVGKVSFAAEQLIENAKAAINAIEKARPAASKGAYIRSITLSATMGPGVHVALKGGTAAIE